MKWFVGSIQEAVHASKQKKAIFVAFIEGKDDTSTQLSQIIESREISSRLEQDHFVAIKIESGTETYRFFAQIYQLVPVPCIYFIDAVGSPIEVVANNCQISELAVKIDDMLVKQGKTASGSSTSFIKSEQKATTVSAPTNVTTLENNSPIASQAEIQSSQESTSELTHEEKVKRAQQLIELQKKQRIEEEIKKGKERELERRKRERELQELRLKQRDLEIKQSHEERLKEKADDAAARERVRQQIAQDKLLRKEKELALKKQATQQSEKQQIITPQSSNNDSSLTRIQFRLPSGSTHMGQFEPTVTLGTLRDYVSTNIEIPFQQFTLSTSFPRRDLLVEDDNKTLTELGLIPTCVILILPLKNKKSREKYSLLNLEERKKILEIFKSDEANGTKTTNAKIARQFNVSHTAIRRMRLQSDEYEKRIQNDEMLDTKLKRFHNPKNPVLEEILYKWCKQKLTDGQPMSMALIKEKALLINQEIDGKIDFKASTGWFIRFKKRYSIDLSAFSGEKLSTDLENSIDFVEVKEEEINIEFEDVNDYNIITEATAAYEGFQLFRNWYQQQWSCDAETMVTFQKLDESTKMIIDDLHSRFN